MRRVGKQVCHCTTTWTLRGHLAAYSEGRGADHHQVPQLQKAIPSHVYHSPTSAYLAPSLPFILYYNSFRANHNSNSFSPLRGIRYIVALRRPRGIDRLAKYIYAQRHVEPPQGSAEQSAAETCEGHGPNQGPSKLQVDIGSSCVTVAGLVLLSRAGKAVYLRPHRDGQKQLPHTTTGCKVTGGDTTSPLHG
jgi:hypothetical protein